MTRATEYPPLYHGPDRPGSRVPRKFGPLTFLKHPALAQVYAAFDKEVPADFWNEDVEAAETIAIISCPCGAEPQVKLHRTEFCSGCDRVFWFIGDTIKVARNPAHEPEQTEPETATEDPPG